MQTSPQQQPDPYIKKKYFYYTYNTIRKSETLYPLKTLRNLIRKSKQ